MAVGDRTTEQEIGVVHKRGRMQAGREEQRPLEAWGRRSRWNAAHAALIESCKRAKLAALRRCVGGDVSRQPLGSTLRLPQDTCQGPLAPHVDLCKVEWEPDPVAAFCMCLLYLDSVRHGRKATAKNAQVRISREAGTHACTHLIMSLRASFL